MFRVKALLAVGVMAMSAAPLVAGEGKPHVLKFDKAKIDELPPGWKAGVTGKGATESV